MSVDACMLVIMVTDFVLPVNRELTWTSFTFDMVLIAIGVIG